MVDDGVGDHRPVPVGRHPREQPGVRRPAHRVPPPAGDAVDQDGDQEVADAEATDGPTQPVVGHRPAPDGVEVLRRTPAAGSRPSWTTVGRPDGWVADASTGRSGRGRGSAAAADRRGGEGRRQSPRHQGFGLLPQQVDRRVPEGTQRRRSWSAAARSSTPSAPGAGAPCRWRATSSCGPSSRTGWCWSGGSSLGSPTWATHRSNARRPSSPGHSAACSATVHDGGGSARRTALVSARLTPPAARRRGRGARPRSARRRTWSGPLPGRRRPAEPPRPGRPGGPARHGPVRRRPRPAPTCP